MAIPNTPTKVGPWGGNGGSARDIVEQPWRLESVTICSGWVVDSVVFSYMDKNGQRHTGGRWGGDGGNAETIEFGATEFLKAVSGTIGKHETHTVISSLTFVTNKKTYGPFGHEHGTPFSAPVPENNIVVGFFGRSGTYLDAIGVYTSLVSPTKFGPWGGDGGSARDIAGKPMHLESVTICSGWVIDSLSFSYIDQAGQRHTEGPWGGSGGSAQTILLGPSEFVKEVSGTIGEHETHTVISSLRLVTNVKTYGPFGRENGTPFSTPVPAESRCAVGFFGRSGTYVDAIGVYMV